MTDPRAIRDDIERAQAELKGLRAQLAKSVTEDSALVTEVRETLATLATERAALNASMGGVGGLRAQVEDTRLWSLAKKTGRTVPSLAPSFELLILLSLLAGYVWCGVLVGDRLYTWELSSQASLAVGAFASAVLFADAARLVRWLRLERHRAPVAGPQGNPRKLAALGVAVMLALFWLAAFVLGHSGPTPSDQGRQEQRVGRHGFDDAFRGTPTRVGW